MVTCVHAHEGAQVRARILERSPGTSGETGEIMNPPSLLPTRVRDTAAIQEEEGIEEDEEDEEEEEDENTL